MANGAANSTPWRVLAQLLGVCALVAACADSSKLGEVDEALAQLRSAESAERHEAVVRLGMLPPSEARRDGLAAAVRDRDDAVRLLAAIVIVGDGLTQLAVSLRPPASSTPNPILPERAPLSPTEELVYFDPWFAGTLLPGALDAARDRDERVRTLGQRALKKLKPGEPPIAEETPPRAPAKPEAAPVVTLTLSDEGLAFEGEALGKLEGATPEEQDRTLGALHARLLPRVADRSTRDADGTSRIQVLIRGDRNVKWKHVQRIMQVCSDPKIQIYKIHFRVTPEKPADPKAATPAK